jgi:hypothetical protein
MIRVAMAVFVAASAAAPAPGVDPAAWEQRTIALSCAPNRSHRLHNCRVVENQCGSSRYARAALAKANGLEVDPQQYPGEAPVAIVVACRDLAGLVNQEGLPRSQRGAPRSAVQGACSHGGVRPGMPC